MKIIEPLENGMIRSAFDNSGLLYTGRHVPSKGLPCSLELHMHNQALQLLELSA
jgi:hypothetical protein